jgi:hypothetical protein
MIGIVVFSRETKSGASIVARWAARNGGLTNALRQGRLSRRVRSRGSPCYRESRLIIIALVLMLALILVLLFVDDLLLYDDRPSGRSNVPLYDDGARDSTDVPLYDDDRRRRGTDVVFYDDGRRGGINVLLYNNSPGSGMDVLLDDHHRRRRIGCALTSRYAVTGAAP